MEKNNKLEGLVRFMKKVLFIIFLVIFVLTANAHSKEVVDRIVAIVNDDIITLSDLKIQLRLYENQIKAKRLPASKEKALLYKVRSQLLDNLINQKLTDQEAKKAKISVSKSEIDKTIERMKEANSLTQEGLIKAIKKEGLTLTEYRKQVKDQILRPRIINYKVRSKIIITDVEIKNDYNKNRSKYAGLKKYDLKHILLKSSPENKKLMVTLLKKLRSGVSFDTISKKHSKSPLVKRGGRLGLINVEDLPDNLKKVIYKTKEHGYSDVVETRQGLQIFYVTKIDIALGKTIATATPEISKKLYNQKIEAQYKIWLRGLKKEAHIRIIK
jgi:peptidyl-prolyl cis-trans isomerase SurA